MHKEPSRKGPLVALTDGSLTEADARTMFEGMRWPNGPVCTFADCDGSEIYRISVAGKTLKSGRVVGPRELFKCKACRRQFSVTKGTAFEDSKIPLRTWLVVMYRMCSSKKSVSARQIEREFGLSHRAAWFMCHRIRWMMTDKNPRKLSGNLEADETYVGGKLRGHPKKRGAHNLAMTGDPRAASLKEAYERKTPVFGIRERDGNIRAQVMPKVSQDNVERAMWRAVDRRNSRLFTDEHPVYANMIKMLPHDVIRHKSEYVRGEVHTQGIESFWAILKRGLVGTYHHVDAGYLAQYVNEYEFRHNSRNISDAERFQLLASQTSGRLDWYLGQQASQRVASEPAGREDLI
jgi:transposase-like protein